ncbi:MAG: hypothetical protein BWY15_00665 [Firmicutes bacterium ADurb.Bin193]|nr:MAG: hypothetical protein BWY15_00665 [Firmicutes bacterium ADurb.Bin193]
MPIWNPQDKDWNERRSEIINILCNEEYGFLPPKPEKLSWEVVEEDNRFCAGKAPLKKVLLKADFKSGSFFFPICVCIPKAQKKYPFFVHINFRDNVPDKYMPSEEICDNGFAVLSFCYKDVTSDDNDFSNGLAGIIYNGKARKDNDSGKIAMWSWAASRVMDYAQTLTELDLTRATIVGHSRLGKTSLLTGATDERFSCAISNESGCSGAAISRGKQGETIKNICNRFPYWFCDNYKKYIDKEFDMPFDQHFLLAAIAPRKVYVASAEEDLWADPVSEFLSCVAASEVFEKMGLDGLIHNDNLPEAGEVFHKGNIGYHLRAGLHFFSREDWLHFIEFLKQK